MLGSGVGEARQSWEPLVPVPGRALEIAGRWRHRVHGEPSRVWRYERGSDGALLAVVARYERAEEHQDAEKGKGRSSKLPWCWCRSDQDGAESWRQRQLKGRLPWLKAPLIAERERAIVVVVEGESTATCRLAEELEATGRYVVTTWPYGHERWKHADLEALLGRVVVFVPDCDWPSPKSADGAGPQSFRKAARKLRDLGNVTTAVVSTATIARWFHGLGDGDEVPTVERDLQGLGPTPVIDLPKGWDLADCGPEVDVDQVEELLRRAMPVGTPVAAAKAKASSVERVATPQDLPVCSEADQEHLVLRDCANYTHSDQGNAQRIWRRYEDRLRYDRTEGQWYVWNGIYWQQDRSQLVDLYAMRCADLIRDEAHVEANPHDSDEVIRHWMSSQGRHRREAMLADLRAMPGVTIASVRDWDRRPHLLATASGVVDLATGDFVAAQQEDMLSRSVPTPYRPELLDETTEHEGRRALARVIGSICGSDRDLQRYLQTAMGYSLLAGNPHEQFFVIYGPSGTGKSTLMHAAYEALSDEICEAADWDSFSRGRKSEIRTDLARLSRSRVVWCDEVRKGQRIDEATLNRATGGSPIISRFHHQVEFAYRSQFKIWLTCEHQPIVSSTSGGVFRRLRMIPVQQRLSEAQRSHKIKSELLGPAGREAVLAWLVQGAVRYHQDPGIIKRPPPAVEQAMADYRASMDNITGWLSTLLIGEGLSAKSTDLRQAYERWCEDEDLEPLRGNDFWRSLQDLGAEPKRNKSGRYYVGVALPDDGGVTPGGGSSGSGVTSANPVEKQASIDISGQGDGGDTGSGFSRDAHAHARASDSSSSRENKGSAVTGVTSGDENDANGYPSSACEGDTGPDSDTPGVTPPSPPTESGLDGDPEDLASF